MKKNFARKLFIYCLGLFLLALGVSISKVADLGISPVNSLPYVISEVFPQLSMGNWIILIFSLYILLQWCILGKEFKLIQISQMLCSFLFGYCTDFTNMITGVLLPTPDQLSDSFIIVYLIRLLYLIVSMFIIALAVLFYLAPGFVPLPSEGIMQAISQRFNKPFPLVKRGFDMTVSVMALIISLVCFKGFHGVREGTLIAAFGVGIILQFYQPLKKPLSKFLGE